MAEMSKRSIKVVGAIAVLALVISFISMAYSLGMLAPAAKRELSEREEHEAQERLQRITGETKEFWLFNSKLEFNESRLGIPHDVFVPDRLVVNQGDRVVIHFYDTQNYSEVFTFTIGRPYNVNVTVDMGQRKDITFIAYYAGVFTFYSSPHFPTMRGELIVLARAQP